ncbi:monocarboxylate transporter 2-like [Haliotis rubra]|uniref:monocarboxylate transporter 2-like n=1 Tax=Haliotis rubra TaxID=36100 RepID=UPI001EE5976D|nr:monocarboxylate transporter 2-like [Haliotis rubra]
MMEKDGDVQKQGWYSYFIIALSFMTLFFNSSLSYASGVFHVALLEAYRADVDATVWLGSLFFSMSSLAGPVASFVINMTDCRTCVVISGILGLVGFSANMFINDIKWLFVTYALLAGLATSLSHTSAVVVLGYHFKHNMSLVCGIAVCGMAIGVFVHPPLCQFLIDTYGLRQAFLIVGAIAFNSCVFGMLMKPTRFERERRAKIFSGRPTCLTLLMALCGDCSGYAKVFRNKSFVFFLLCGCSFGMGTSAMYLYLPDFLRKQGISLQAASFSVSTSGIGGVLSRFLTGFAAQDPGVGSGLIFASLNGLMGVLSFLIPLFTSTSVTVCVYGFFVGIYTGSSWALFNPITFEILGVELMATGFGALMGSCGIGFLIGPPLAGYVFKIFQEYYGVYIFAGVMFLSCTVCGFLSTTFRKSPKTLHDTADPSEVEAIALEERKSKDDIML